MKRTSMVSTYFDEETYKAFEKYTWDNKKTKSTALYDLAVQALREKSYLKSNPLPKTEEKPVAIQEEKRESSKNSNIDEFGIEW